MLEYLGQALVTWAKTELQEQVERVFNSRIFEADDDDAVCLYGFPRTIQLDDHSCGVQVLRAVLAYYERDVGVFDIHWELEDKEGLADPLIREVLARHDLRCRLLQNGWRKLEGAINREQPVIVSLDDEDHWAVVFGHSPSHIYLMDPSLRRLVGHRVTRARFAKRWDNWGLAVRER